jgi:cytochrome P450
MSRFAEPFAVDASAAVHDKLPELSMPFDPPANRRNPYPDFSRFRKDSPVLVSRPADGPPLVWLFRRDDVVAALTDHARFSNQAAQVFLGPTLGEDLLVGKDPPEHGRYRRLITPAFSPAAIAQWRETWVLKTIDELLDGVARQSEPDLVRDLAFILPTLVISRILGLPEQDSDRFRAWTMDFISVAGDPGSAHASGEALRNYLDPLIRARMAEPGEDLISRLCNGQIDGQRLSYNEILSFVLTLLPAGIETTYRALGSLLFVLLSEPPLWKAIVQDKTLARAAVEEILRFEAPLQVVFRTARTKVELSGTTVEAGSYVIPVIGSANRDNALGADMDKFLLDRTDRSYLTFGSGGHSCVGMHLAKVELTAAVEALATRFPRMTLDTAAARMHDIHIRGLMVRSPSAVPVLLN